MKKILLLFMLPLIFSCSKDNEKDDNSNDLLSNTTWHCILNTGENNKDVYSIIFDDIKSVTVTYTIYNGKVITKRDSKSGTYTYNPPTLVIRTGNNTQTFKMTDGKLISDSDYTFEKK